MRTLQIETVTTLAGRMDVIRDVDTVRKIIDIAEKAMVSIRSFPCGHKPAGVGGRCGACDALAEWDAMQSPNPEASHGK